MPSIFPIILFLISGGQILSSALQCYSCTATVGYEDRCENLSYVGDDLPSHTCLFRDAVCVKYLIDHGDEQTVIRTCEPGGSDNCRTLSWIYNTNDARLIDCQRCWDRDFCNDGNVPNFTLLLFVTAFSSLIIVFN